MTLSLPSVSSPLCDPPTVAFAIHNGFYLNRSWVASIPWDAGRNVTVQIRDFAFNKSKEILKKLPKDLAKELSQVPRRGAILLPYWLFFYRAMDIASSFRNLESALVPTRVTHFAKGWFPNPKRSFFWIATSLFALNAIKFFKERANEPKWIPNISTEIRVKEEANDFLAVVWRATPYLMIITNIAVTVLQIYQGSSAQWVTLAVTGVTLLPITNLVPQSFNEYLTMCGIPIDLAALWYGDSYMRTCIIVGWIFRSAL